MFETRCVSLRVQNGSQHWYLTTSSSNVELLGDELYACFSKSFLFAYKQRCFWWSGWEFQRRNCLKKGSKFNIVVEVVIVQLLCHIYGELKSSSLLYRYIMRSFDSPSIIVKGKFRTIYIMQLRVIVGNAIRKGWLVKCSTKVSVVFDEEGESLSGEIV